VTSGATGGGLARLWRRLTGGGRLRHVLTPGTLNGIAAEGGDRYRATELRSSMTLVSNRHRLPRGWVEISYRVQAPDRVATPCLAADPGDGIKSGDRKSLAPTQGATATCHLRLPDQVRELRFEPVSWIGPFEMPPVRMREITRFQLGLGLLRRLLREDGIVDLIARYRRGGWAGFKEYLARHATQQIAVYENWRDLYWTLDEADRAAIVAHIRELPSRPRFSVVMPTYNTDPALLQQTIDSVTGQLYPDWELCIADDASTDPAVRPVMERAAAADNRIKVTFRSDNGHIAEASNSALDLATGDFVALLDHDDLLTPDALYWMAVELNRHPDADILYSDEDKIDPGGRLYDPHFKPDWSPELLLSRNYVNHPGVYRRDLVEAVGRFRDAFRGSQDYDLLLRVVERTSADRIRHVPVVLYHWRAVTGSVAASGDAKDYAQDAARRAIAEHLTRTGQTAEVGSTPDGLGHRIVPSLPDPAPKVSIIVPTRDRLPLLRMCVTGLLETTAYPNWELIVVDNGSVEPDTRAYLQALEEDPRIRVLRDDGPFNFSRLNNRGVEIASGELILMLNNDIEPIAPDWLTEMVRQLQRDGVGAVGAKLYFPDDTVQHVGVTLGIGGVAGHFEKRLPREADGYFSRPNLVHNASAATGACLLTRRDLWDRVGGLDEQRLAVAFNDVDFCLKLRALGLRIVVTPYAELYHHESVSRGTENSPEKVARFRAEAQTMLERWPEALAADPYFNPNLHIDSEHPILGFPPRVEKPWAPWMETR